MVAVEPVSIGSMIAALIQDSGSAAAAAGQPVDVARGFRFLIGAYTVVWLILAAYMMTLSARLRRLSRQVRRLKERVQP